MNILRTLLKHTSFNASILSETDYILIIFTVAAVLLVVFSSVMVYSKRLKNKVAEEKAIAAEKAREIKAALKEEMMQSVKENAEAILPNIIASAKVETEVVIHPQFIKTKEQEDSTFYPSLVLTIDEVKKAIDEVEEDEEVEEDDFVTMNLPLKKVKEEEKAFLMGPRVHYIDPNTIILKNSLESKMKQSQKEVKERYSEIKNHIMSFEGIKDRFSKRFDSFRQGRVTIARIAIRGRNLKLYLAIEKPNALPAKYHIKDVGNLKSFNKTPAYLKIRSERSVRYAKDLITMVMAEHGIQQVELPTMVDYVELFPFVEGAVIDKPLMVNIVRSNHEIDEQSTNNTIEVNAKMEHEDRKETSENIEWQRILVNDHTLKRVNHLLITLGEEHPNDEMFDIDDILNHKMVHGKSDVTLRLTKNGEPRKEITIKANQFAMETIKTILITGESYVKVISRELVQAI